MSILSNPGGGSSLKIPSANGTTVYNAASSPTGASWTDLDLSGEVGTRECLVLLRCYRADSNNLRFRMNGATFAPTGSGDHTNEYWSGGAGGDTGGTLVRTDANGIVEWVSGVSAQTNIYLLAYLPVN